MNHLRKHNSFLMVASQYPPVYGGAGAQAAILSQELGRKGWRGLVITLDQLAVGSEQAGPVSIRRVMRGRAGKGKLSRVATTLGLGWAAFAAVVRMRPSVVHVHGAYWWSIPPILVAKFLGIRTVLKSTRDGEDDAQTLLSKSWRGLKIGWLYSLSLRMCDTFIVLNSEGQRSAELAGYGAKCVRMTNAVNVPALVRTPSRRANSRKTLGVDDGVTVFVFVGYLVRHKGIFDLLEAWRIAMPEGAELWLVGPSTGFYRELSEDPTVVIDALRARGAKIRQFGHVDGSKIPGLLWAADVFVLPSYAEGMPNALLEAGVAGCRLIATPIPGVLDVIRADEAILVEPGDVNALARALLDEGALPTSTLAERVGLDQVSERYISLYASTRESPG